MSDNQDRDWGKVADQSDEAATLSSEELRFPQGEHEGAAEMDAGDDSMGILDHPDYQALQEKLTQAEQLAHQNLDKAMRALSDLENGRRRFEQELSNAHKYGIQKFAEAMLPIIDSLEQALQMSGSSEGQEGLMQGVALTLKMFSDTLARFSVQQINPEGEPFDPNKHEAMKMEVNEAVEPGTVLMVFQKGYQLHERVIRPARVIVSTTAS